MNHSRVLFFSSPRKNWLLSVPGEYQEGWDRLIVSPALAAWHDVYLGGVIMVLVAVAVASVNRYAHRCSH